jgi:hypothetical protein
LAHIPRKLLAHLPVCTRRCCQRRMTSGLSTRLLRVI